MALRDPEILHHTMSREERHVLDDFVSRLRGHFGERVGRVAVFGSRARGDVSADSDIDLLIVLKIPEDAEDEASNVVWELIRLAKQQAPRNFVPLSPAIFSESRFEAVQRRERRFARDADAEGILL